MSYLEYANKSSNQVITEFNSSSQSGLTDDQVIKHRTTYGINKLLKKEKTWLEFFISQYKSPIIVLLLLAAVVSLFLGEYLNGITIFFIVIINTAIGFYQEYKATQAVKLLEQYLERSSKVIRNNQEVIIKNKNIVPGDIVLLEPGDYVPADIRFIETYSLMIDESSLSGESLPVSKNSPEVTQKIETLFNAVTIGFSGTIVVEGYAKGIVFNSGQETLSGKIGDLTISTVHDTKFYQNIKKISYFLIKMIAVTLIILIILYLLFKPSTISVSEILMFAVALAVGIAPEALPTMSIFSLSRGAIILARNNVIVKRLSSIEDLGGLEIICTDKTGTITKNILTIQDIKIVNNDNLDPVFYTALAAARVFDIHKRPESPFDAAVWDILDEQNFTLLSHYQRIKEIPFDAQHRRNLVIVKHKTTTLLITKGSYREIIPKTTLSNTQLNMIDLWIKEKAQEGCRVIAVAKKELNSVISAMQSSIWDQEKEMQFIGLIALQDPIKSTVKETIKKAKKLGVLVKIITGDDPEIAGYIASEIGLIEQSKEVITGTSFALLSDNDKEEIAHKISVFARFLPEQKSEIIKILKKKKSVAYLGDGINDAPALKAADVGLAVDSSTDIAKDAADIVLLKNNLKVIIEGIIIGRKIFVNTFNYLKITLASNLGNFYSIAIISLFTPFLPLLPLQILLVNLLSDIPMIVISTDNVAYNDIMRPTAYHLKNLIFFIIIFGCISSFFDIIFFYNFYKNNTTIFQTYWFIFSIITEILFIFSGRTKRFFTKALRPSWPLIIFSVAALIVTVSIPYMTMGQKIFSFVRPEIWPIYFMIILAILYFIASEIGKLLYYTVVAPRNINQELD